MNELHIRSLCRNEGLHECDPDPTGVPTNHAGHTSTASFCVVLFHWTGYATMGHCDIKRFDDDQLNGIP